MEIDYPCGSPARSRVLRRSIIRSINALAGIAHYIADVFTTHRLSRLSRTQWRVYTVTRRQNKLAEWRASVFREDPLPARRRRAPPCLPSGAVGTHREFRTRFARVRSPRMHAPRGDFKTLSRCDASRRTASRNRDRIGSLARSKIGSRSAVASTSRRFFSKLAAIFRKTEKDRCRRRERERERK